MCDFCEREENDLITCNQSGIIRTCFQDNEGNFLYNGEIGAGDAVDGSELSFSGQNSLRYTMIFSLTYITSQRLTLMAKNKKTKGAKYGHTPHIKATSHPPPHIYQLVKSSILSCVYR